MPEYTQSVVGAGVVVDERDEEAVLDIVAEGSLSSWWVFIWWCNVSAGMCCMSNLCGVWNVVCGVCRGVIYAATDNLIHLHNPIHYTYTTTHVCVSGQG